MKSTDAAIFAATLILVSGGVEAQTHLDTTGIDQVVISKLSAQFGINSKVITHLDLTQPFQTKSRWSLVATKQPDEESIVEDGAGNRIGAVSLCFVENDEPDCSEEMFLAKYREEKVGLASGEARILRTLWERRCVSRPGENDSAAEDKELYESRGEWELRSFDVPGRLRSNGGQVSCRFLQHDGQE
jgi:hypothetical protein